jgi:hypothetical protein
MRSWTKRNGGDGEPAFGDILAVVLDGDASWREGASPHYALVDAPGRSPTLSAGSEPRRVYEPSDVYESACLPVPLAAHRCRCRSGRSPRRRGVRRRHR